MILKILLGLDSTPSTDVSIRQCIELAKQHNAELTGIAVVNVRKLENVGSYPIGTGIYAKRLREFRLKTSGEHIEKAIMNFESVCGSTGVNHSVKRETGKPLDVMVSQARYYDLIVLGLRSPFDYEVAKGPKNMICRLVAEGVRPVLAVGSGYRSIRRVFINYDGSIGSANAMKQFVQMGLWPNATIRIVCFGMEIGEAKQLLADASKYCLAYGFETDVEHVSANNEHQLLTHATEWETDLIVMGNPSRRFLTHTIWGDATIHAIEDSDISIFLSQ